MRAVAVGLSLIIAAPALAQPPAGRLRRDGTEFFRAVLRQAGTRPVSSVAELLESPRDKVLIVFGDTEPLDRMIESGDLRQFLRESGSVLVATDRQTSAAFLGVTSVQVSGQFVIVGRDNAYRKELTECPIVVDHPPGGSRHAIFSTSPNPSHVATNRPSFVGSFGALSGLDKMLPVAWLPAMGELRIGSVPGALKAPHALAVANSAKSMHLLVIADHSIFINDMMSQQDNGNIAFAYGVVRWLTDDGRRKGVLFIDEGEIRTDFNVSLDLPQPRVPPLEALVPLANEAIAKVEKENVINQMLLEMAGGPWTVLRTIFFLLTVCLLAFGLYRFMQARHRMEARPSVAAASADGVLSAVERRYRAVIAQGNLAEAARELAHQAFAAVGVSPAAGARPPAVLVEGWAPLRGVWWDHQVGRLWRLAVRGPRRRVSPAALRRLDASVHRLLAAVAAGRVRLAGSNSAI
jgi:hypothetical protein